MAQQLGLDLPSRPALGRDDFFVAPSNAIAVAMIEGWQAWAGRKMVLTGPPGSGKTHLAHVWAADSGARVVQASLDGEDWTALWSDSMDLATAESDIPRALAADAAAMLAIEPDPLAKWISSNLDPRLGNTSWAWALSGASDDMQRALSRMAKTQPVAPNA